VLIARAAQVMINQLLYVTSLYCGEKCAWLRDAVDNIWQVINWKFSSGRICVNSDKGIYHTSKPLASFCYFLT